MSLGKAKNVRAGFGMSGLIGSSGAVHSQHVTRSNRKRRRQRRHNEARATQKLEQLIPAGGVTSERGQHDELVTEATARSLRGDAIEARQVVSSPVRKLLEAGAISTIEAGAAARLREDHDLAHMASSSSLAAFL